MLRELSRELRRLNPHNMPIINKRDQALSDLEDLAFYISENNPAAARAFLSAAEGTLITLSQQPKMGVARTYNNPKLKHMRMFPVSGYGNFLLFYFPLPKNEGIDLVRVLHGSRDMSAVFE